MLILLLLEDITVMFLNFYFEMISDLQKKVKIILFPYKLDSFSLEVSILHNHKTIIKAKK